MRFSMFPFSRFHIEGRSMMPAFRHGDRLIVCRWGSVREGDGIVFSKNGLTMIKRAIKQKDDCWIVRGDNVLESIESEIVGEVPSRNIIGKVIARY